MSSFDWTQPIRRLRPEHVFDAGASCGGWFPLWLEVGAKRIVGCEPTPDMFAQMMDRYGDDLRVTCLPLAVSDRPGDLRNVNVHGAWSLLPEGTKKLAPALEYKGKPAFSCEVDTIDRICARELLVPSLIKIDVDGYDAKALRGAWKTIAEHRPMIMLELSGLPDLVGDCPACMVYSLFAAGYAMQSVVTGKIYRTPRELMPDFPWNSSWDVICIHADSKVRF